MRHVLLILSIGIVRGCSSDDGPVTQGPPEDGADTVPPFMIGTCPADGATEVNVNADITVTFSETIAVSSPARWSFYLSNDVAGVFTFDCATNTVCFNPGLNLAYRTTYSATITRGLTDTAGNPLETAYQWSFSTIKIPLMPLAVGNRWSYFVEKWDTAGQLTAQYYDTILIDHQEIIDNEAWFADDDNRRYALKGDGLWRTGIFGHRYLQAKFPADIGDQYPGDPGWNLLGLQEHISVLETKTEVITEAGAFNCYQYCTWIEGRHRYNYYYSPGVGLVQSEVFRDYAKSGWPVRIERRTLVTFDLQ